MESEVCDRLVFAADVFAQYRNDAPHDRPAARDSTPTMRGARRSSATAGIIVTTTVGIRATLIHHAIR